MESHESAQLLTIPEEKALVKCITQLIASIFPVTHDLLQDMAEEIRQRRLHGINESSIEYLIGKISYLSLKIFEFADFRLKLFLNFYEKCLQTQFKHLLLSLLC